MTTSELITDYKNKLALKLVNTDGLVEAMGNDDIEEPDEAIYTYIFPYFHIPDTIEAAHSYICFKVNMTDRSNVNDWYENFTLTVWVIVNQALMKMKGHGGATRVDYLSGLVEKELHGSTIFGIKQLKITSNMENYLNDVKGNLKDFDVEKFSEVTSALLDNKQEISAVLAKDKKE